MTSPNTKAAEKTPQKKALTTAQAVDGAAAAEGSAAMLPPSNTQFRSCGLFSWMKVFRYADMLMRQGC